jgi:hypothetical protein
MPDQRWLLDALSALNPDHMVFMKGYVPDKTTIPGLGQKLELLRECPEIKHPLFLGLPPQLLARKKALKNAVPTIVQPQVSHLTYFESYYLKLDHFRPSCLRHVLCST